MHPSQGPRGPHGTPEHAGCLGVVEDLLPLRIPPYLPAQKHCDIAEVSHGDRTVADLDMEFLHHGVPRREGTAEWTPPRHPEPDLPPKADYTDDLLAVLGAWNVCSKEWVVRQYDHEVQGQTVVKPLVGVENDGPGDAAAVETRAKFLAHGYEELLGRERVAKQVVERENATLILQDLNEGRLEWEGRPMHLELSTNNRCNLRGYVSYCCRF